MAAYAALREEAVGSGAKIFFADEAHFRADAELRGRWVLREPALVNSSSPRYGEKASYYSAVCLETRNLGSLFGPVAPSPGNPPCSVMHRSAERPVGSQVSVHCGGGGVVRSSWKPPSPVPDFRKCRVPPLWFRLFLPRRSAGIFDVHGGSQAAAPYLEDGEFHIPPTTGKDD